MPSLNCWPFCLGIIISCHYLKRLINLEHSVLWDMHHLNFPDDISDWWLRYCELALRWMSLDLTDDKSTLDQVMAWCRHSFNSPVSSSYVCNRYWSSVDLNMSRWIKKPDHQHDFIWLERQLMTTRSVHNFSHVATTELLEMGKRMTHNIVKSTKYHLWSMNPYRRVLLVDWHRTWWRHRMETFSALLVLCTGNSPVTGEFPAKRPVTRCFVVSFDLRLNKRLSKQSWGWWFEKSSSPLWRHRNDTKSVDVVDLAAVWWHSTERLVNYVADIKSYVVYLYKTFQIISG